MLLSLPCAVAINHEARGAWVGNLQCHISTFGWVLKASIFYCKKKKNILLSFFHILYQVIYDCTWQRKVVQSGMARPKYSNIFTICHQLMFKYFSKISNHRISMYFLQCAVDNVKYVVMIAMDWHCVSKHQKGRIDCLSNYQSPISSNYFEINQ